MTFPSVSGEFMLASVASRPQLATDVPGAVGYTGQSRAQLYKDMRTGLLPAYKNGTRTILFYDDLERYMRALPRAKFRPVVDNEGNERAVNGMGVAAGNCRQPSHCETAGCRIAGIDRGGGGK